MSHIKSLPGREEGLGNTKTLISNGENVGIVPQSTQVGITKPQKTLPLSVFDFSVFQPVEIAI